MSNNWTEGEYRTATILAISPYLFIGLIVLIGIIKCAVEPKIDPMDNSIMKMREIVEHLQVKDSTNNGFRISYATEKEVTKERLREIRSRPHVKDAFRQLQKEAPIHFGGLLETDIYDFAEFALKYMPDENVVMHNIFVVGKEKCDFYIGPNPKIKNPAVYFHFGTEQGNLYIKNEDIYYHRSLEKRVYRYWKCQGLNALSTTEERFSHFSEDDRIW